MVLYCTRHKPDVAIWGSLRKKEHDLKVEENRIKRENKEKETAKREQQEKENAREGREETMDPSDSGEISG